MEVQINGGSIADKVEFGLKLFESAIPVDTVFNPSEVVDSLAITKGHGFEGVIARWGVTRLPRKTHKGLRKVACIGAWHPSRVGYTVPRAGQDGFHHRVMANKKIYKIGKSAEVDKGNARCETDLTDKVITPMGGFPKYGIVNQDYMLIKGTIQGPIKRVITLRKALRVRTSKSYTEQINVKFIDTSSKWGHGKFQVRDIPFFTVSSSIFCIPCSLPSLSNADFGGKGEVHGTNQEVYPQEPGEGAEGTRKVSQANSLWVHAQFLLLGFQVACNLVTW